MKRTFDELVSLMQTLRGPGGCPWDREQTLTDLKPFIIEEAYETVDAIEKNDRESLKEEVGDLLLEAVFVAEIASEEGSFNISDSITAIYDKLVRRHPHVFAGATAGTSGEVLENWERLKSAERAGENKGVLSGVPASLPALLKASRLTEKASRVGFDWKDADQVFEKIEEEVAELREAAREESSERFSEELGDLLFALANLARKMELNAEESLQRTNQKFTRRFEFIEQQLRATERTFDDVSLEQMDELWNEAKKVLGSE